MSQITAGSSATAMRSPRIAASPANRDRSRSRARGDLVRFNVGGKVYETLRDPTLSLHPNSILYQLAEDHRGEEPIFVEANSEIFQYVLDYHRNRRVFLPHTVSKDAVVFEAGKLGITIKPEELVQQSAPLSELGRLTAEELSSQCQQASNRERIKKAELLAELIVKVALSKLGRTASITVSAGEIVGAEGRVIKRCGGVCPRFSSARYERWLACDTESMERVDWNEFTPVINFLTEGVTRFELRDKLMPWAQKNGFVVDVGTYKKAPDCHSHAQFSCTFSPASSA